MLPVTAARARRRAQKLEWAIGDGDRARRTTTWRRRSIASGSTRSPRCAATCCSGSSGSSRDGGVGARALRACVRPAADDATAIRRRSPSRRRWTAALPAARLDRPGGAPRRRHRRCASPITRPARTARRWRRIVDGGRVLQPVLYGWRSRRSPASRRRGPAVVLHGGRRLQRAPITLDDAARRSGSRCSRSIDRRDRARHAGGAAGADGACEWCDFSAVCGRDEERAHAPQAGRLACRPRRAAEDAVSRRPSPTPTTAHLHRRGARRRRWSSRPRPAPARRPSWSSASSG